MNAVPPPRGPCLRGDGPPWPFILLLGLAAAWGSAFLFIKVAVATLPPLTMTCGRIIIAAILLNALVLARGERYPTGWRTWRLIAVIGAIGQILPFVLLGYGETKIDSGLAAIIVSTVPLGTMVLAHLFTKDDRLDRRKLAGVGAGLLGIVVLVGPDALAGLGAHVLGQLAVLAAALSYAVTNVCARGLRHLSPSVSSACTALTAAAWSAPLALWIDRPWSLAPSTESLAALAALALFSTAAGSLMFFRLIGLSGASFVSMTNFLIPLVAMGLGMTLLGESPPWQALVALLLVLTGIGAVLKPRRSAL